MKKNIINCIAISILIISVFSTVSPVIAQNNTIAQTGFFSDFLISPGAIIEVPVEIRNVSELYAFEFTMEFDPALLTVEDDDTARPGFQIGVGKFLDSGLTLFNDVDNEQGTIRYTMTQTNPSLPKTGSGIVLVIRFKGNAEGTSDLKITSFLLSTRDGIEIPASISEKSIKIESGFEPQVKTPIPVQDPGIVVLVPTAGPTTAVVVVTEITPTPMNTDLPLVETIVPTPIEILQPATIPITSSNVAIGDWWVEIGLGGLVLIAGIVLVVIRKKKYRK